VDLPDLPRWLIANNLAARGTCFAGSAADLGWRESCNQTSRMRHAARIAFVCLPAAPDGDRFSIDLHDAAGATIYSVVRIVTYVTSQPNGPGCEPVCRSAIIDER
jgi:hypothetical protein